MKARCLAPLLFAVALAGSGFALAHVLERPTGPATPRFSAPAEVVKIFLEAVKRGELVVLGRKLDASMLKPVRVEYVYDLDSAIPRIKVYSELQPPIPVPAHAGCRLGGIGAILDDEGHIVGTEAHVVPEQ
jgi:hypothetical protein